jgi:hypothetical protein
LLLSIHDSCNSWAVSLNLRAVEEFDDLGFR